MTGSEAKKYMLIERECINRDCNRDCANCDIVQKVEYLNNAYNIAINALEKQIPKTPSFYAHNYHCIFCDNLVGNNEFEWQRFKYCDVCGQAIDWSESE